MKTFALMLMMFLMNSCAENFPRGICKEDCADKWWSCTAASIASNYDSTTKKYNREKVNEFFIACESMYSQCNKSCEKNHPL